MGASPDYAELSCLSNFTFLTGASHPEELVEQASALGYRALAITDECSLAGIVRAHVAAKTHDIQLLVGATFKLENDLQIVLLASSLKGYQQLSQLISQARRDAGKGAYTLALGALSIGLSGCLLIVSYRASKGVSVAGLIALQKNFKTRMWLGYTRLLLADDQAQWARITQLSEQTHIPMVALGQVCMHQRERKPLQDVLTAIRLATPVAELGYAALENAECCLRPKSGLATRYTSALLAETVRIAQRCCFSLDQLRYEYPQEVVPANTTPIHYLRSLTTQGIHLRWPSGPSAAVRTQIEKELVLIQQLRYEAYFLTVYDIVRFARSREILCQGRGSAANSAVCFCLFITEVDPMRMNMLFERFISKERDEPPDIDVDFEHHRREEVIQYIYQKYGRHRAALTATVIRYRRKSAIRDVAKALGFPIAQVEQLVKLPMPDADTFLSDLAAAGFAPNDVRIQYVFKLVKRLLGFPRHLSQHVGGFVISQQPLTHIVPVENAAMPDRTIIQWDKEDLDQMGLLKIDILALGMLTAIHQALDLINAQRKGHNTAEPDQGDVLSMQNIPAEDPQVYQMMCRADTIGVFQIESRAQMSMLPRLRPTTFYDLVVEIALIRPGPIQGDMVHPYLRRRQGLEAIVYPSKALRDVLARTLGIPIFQEQIIQLAMVAAGFSAGEADQLRRAISSWRRREKLAYFKAKLLAGMIERGYDAAFAQQIYAQIEGFGEYGFPESHAASFALLAYVSAWLKCHEPAAFTCALLNCQPMGFYAPAQLIQDAKRHAVVFYPVDITHSDCVCRLQLDEVGKAGIRLGFNQVKGLSKDAAQRLVAARSEHTLSAVAQLKHRLNLNQRDIDALAAANALESIAGHRHQARWLAYAIQPELPLFDTADQPHKIEPPKLPTPQEKDNIAADYQALGFTLGRHPLALLRDQLKQRRVVESKAIQQLKAGTFIHTAGLIITRQRPYSAKGVTFLTLEDEYGNINIVVWEAVFSRFQRIVTDCPFIGVFGKVEREGQVIHVIAKQLMDYHGLLTDLVTPKYR